MIKCWQYQKRLEYLEADIKEIGLISNLKVSDFIFKHVSFEDKKKIEESKNFIKKYEWLGTIPGRITNYFEARYKDTLAGVIILTYPNSFTKKLMEFKNKERLIARGACASWTPKNLASKLISYSIDWMVKNTDIRIFTAYSDIEAGEIGTIYQACNFYYLGNTFGNKIIYNLPNTNKWVGSRYFNKLRNYKKYAKHLGIYWDSSWEQGKYGINWKIVPKTIEIMLKQEKNRIIKLCKSKKVELKHKYLFIKGKSKKESKYLLKTISQYIKLTKNYPKRYLK